MNVDGSKWIERFDLLVRQTGACAWGICRATDIDEGVLDEMTEWIAGGKNAGMDYLARHIEMKKNLNSVLPGCRSIVSVIFPYYTTVQRRRGSLVISRHALGDDYHAVIKRQLKPLSAFIMDDFGGKTRVCVDSAPVAERYWALKCGVGSVGKNGLVYVPGYGSWVFVAEILSTAELPERHGGTRSKKLELCEKCNKCVDSCPGHAIESGGKIDCRRCRSYLTVENRDDTLPEGINLRERVYGCDVCQEVCPANDIPLCDSPLFSPRKELLDLTLDELKELDEVRFKALTRGTSMTRINLNQLKRNAGLKE